MLRGMAAKPGKSTDILDAVALIVVDMQTTFLDVIDGAPAVVERCGFAIEAARALGLRVVFTEQVPSKIGPTDPRLLALVPNARVFPKTTFSALQAEGLLDYLRRQGIYHLLLVGIEIPVCIYQTALHAVDSDLDVTVLSDCVTGRRAEDCLVTLDALTRAHCHVLPAETVYYSMLGNSTHPLFSAFNALVKRYSQPGGLDAAPAQPPPREFVSERRPVLAPPEDHPDARGSDADEFANEPGEGGGDSEPYIGRTSDGAPAGEAREDSSRRFDDDEEDRAAAARENGDGDEETSPSDDDDESDDEDGESRDEDDGAEVRGEPRAGSNDRNQSRGGGGEPGGPGGRRRGRRRRGGARRRRARERREGSAQGPGQAHGGDRGGNRGGGGSSPSSEGESRNAGDAPQPERTRDAGSSGDERPSE